MPWALSHSKTISSAYSRSRSLSPGNRSTPPLITSIRAVSRMSSMHFANIKLFMDAMTDYNNIQIDFRDANKARIKRQLEIGMKNSVNHLMFLTLSKTITTIMHQYGRIQIEHKERCKALLKRQLEVAQRSVTDNELENMLESGNPQIFTQGVSTFLDYTSHYIFSIEYLKVYNR
ncbi:unnamed protein product [Schistosoma margrebowiei]|uniref:Syntaxin N-terminal domain-containing protein n=1 Tax=Schistosoma margrebowiei TaxID=48269 RepID=A0A183LZZ9_9TREM|nr:unnamed protein product [Schistosoma margrebowiei]